MLCIDREVPRPRKDLIKWGDIKELYAYCFDDFKPQYKFKYDYVYEIGDDFQKVKAIAGDNVRDFTQQMRLCLTGKENTPDLFKICEILGEKVVNSRLRARP
jgi:hypothetical protein